MIISTVMLRLTEDAVICLCKFCHSYANVNIIRND